MFHLPTFKRLRTSGELEAFSRTYFQCSGFDVNLAYFMANQVFGVEWQGRMVGGFVLGTGERLRTLEVFAGTESRPALYHEMQQAEAPTEICCFWMDPATRKKTWLNFFVWCCMAYSLQVFGTEQLVFGTNSARLALLYSATPKCRLLHSDCINNRRTFIYTGPRRHCLLGVGQILCYKIRRLVKLDENRARRQVVVAA
ncbi:MAG: hypothetical protein IPN76_12870 [Saprospiraceae bacterium]|nr:hypothetical protein [Saprospiraceae bacterium]